MKGVIQFGMIVDPDIFTMYDGHGLIEQQFFNYSLILVN